MTPSHPLIETFSLMVREQLPNLFRLYVNPHVTQACFCLEQYVQTTWSDANGSAGPESGYQTYLANGFDEALGGAIKLARYASSVEGRPTTGLVIDFDDRIGSFASARMPGGETIEFVPGLKVADSPDSLAALNATMSSYGWVVLIASSNEAWKSERVTESLRCLTQPKAESARRFVLTCVDRQSLAALRRDGLGILGQIAPDMVVFDESFANRDVPFGAFAARKKIYDYWNRPGKTTFHSTTYQPNTISSLHFMRCLRSADSAFFASVEESLNRIEADMEFRGAMFRRLYSASLFKATRAAGFEKKDVRAAGDFVIADGRKVFDGVSGVACSVRGHNPPNFAREIEDLSNVADVAGEVAIRLRELTGLENCAPAVSGATAIENALKIALVAQWPKKFVLALKSGFGGKTLFALTGTWKSSYKQHINPLFDHVIYVDPFADDAIQQIDAALAAHPIAVVQMELIQGVGGVREIPETVVRHLAEARSRSSYLLLIDEVQTGMFRTGPFVRSTRLGINPDLLVVGKGVSDMMFPFALLLCSNAVREKLERAGSHLPQAISRSYGYEYGYKTVLNVLRRAEQLNLPERVAEADALLSRLKQSLRSCKAVHSVRVFGLLIGIELETRQWPKRWFGKRLFQIYVLGMLRHPTFPVLAGFCQYEPNVLKITPSLSADPKALDQMCQTIVQVLNRPFVPLAAAVAGQLLGTTFFRRNKHGNNSPLPAASQPASC